MKRHVKHYKANVYDRPDVDIRYRNLTIAEHNILNGFVQDINKFEYAFDTAVVKSNIDNPDFALKIIIGREILDSSYGCLADEELLELTVTNFRESLKTDSVIDMMAFILKKIPNITFDYMSSLTINDLVELVCFAELATKEQYFDFGKNKKQQRENPQAINRNRKSLMQDLMNNIPDQSADTSKSSDGHMYFEDDGKTLAEKMKENMKFYR